jgi:hypothetical protein
MSKIQGTFSLEAFQQSQFEGAGDTRFLLIDAKEYMAMIKGPYGQERCTRLRQEKDYLIFDVVFELDDPEQKQKLGVENLPSVRKSIFLDLTESGGLDMGPFKNGDLNRLRDVCGLNEEGKSWKFSDFIGKPVRVKVKHRPDQADPKKVYLDVGEVTKA